MTTKSVQEAHGIPTREANAAGLRMTRMGIYLARGMRLDGMPEYEREKALIRAEVRAIVDRTLEMGDGDAALGTVHAFEAGVLDVPWSPNRHVKSRIMPARDADGYLRVLDPGAVPLPREVMDVHQDGLARRAEKLGCAVDHELAVQSVYEHSEPLAQLLPDGWFRDRKVVAA